MALPRWRRFSAVLLLLVLLASSVVDAFLLQQRLTPPHTGRRAATVVMTQTAPRSTPVPSSLRLLLPLLLGGAAPLLQIAPGRAETATTTTVTPAAAGKEPTEAQLQAVRDAFKAFDGKDLNKAERLFDRSVKVGRLGDVKKCRYSSGIQSVCLIRSINPIVIRHGKTSAGRATSWGPC